MVASFIQVDDADTKRITYDSSWQTAGSAFEHESTTHWTKAAKGLATFSFNGTSVAVYGTVPSGLKLATIGCSVDGVNAAQPPSIVPSPTTALYNQVFCTFPNLSNDREHQLVLNVDGSASTFFLDYILYLYDDSSRQAAVPATSLANILIDDANTDLITYAGPGAAWNTEGGNGEFRQTTHHTVTAGATATFKFSGTGVQVFGTIGVSSLTARPFIATFSIDGGAPTRYISPALTTVAQQIRFFQSPLIADGPHTLVVTQSASATSGFWLDFFLYTASPSFGIPAPVTPSSSSSVSSTSSSSSSVRRATATTTKPTTTHKSDTASQTATSASSSHTGVAVGATIAVLVLLGGAIAAFLWWRRRRRAQDDNASINQPASVGRDPNFVIDPFTIPTHNNTSYYQDNGGAGYYDRELPPQPMMAETSHYQYNNAALSPYGAQPSNSTGSYYNSSSYVGSSNVETNGHGQYQPEDRDPGPLLNPFDAYSQPVAQQTMYQSSTAQLQTQPVVPVPTPARRPLPVPGQQATAPAASTSETHLFSPDVGAGSSSHHRRTSSASTARLPWASDD